jgi:putative ABC transport system permease protein
MVFAMLAIIISCLGLFGLASYTVVRRSKEISIRKVMGATARQIMTLLSYEYIRLVIIASVVALPVAFWAVKKWLNAYAYKMQIGYELFALPVALILEIALLTITYQTLKASGANPSDSLRHE